MTGTDLFGVIGLGSSELFWVVGLVCFVAAAAFVAAVRRPPVAAGNRKAQVRVGKIFEALYSEETTKSTPTRERKAK